MTTKDKKHLAKVLYLDSGLSQKDIAERLGIHASQLNTWVKGKNWDKLKHAGRVTRKQIALDLQKRIFEISQDVEKDGRIITASEADTITKLNACVRDLDKSTDLATYMQAFEEFIKYITHQDKELGEVIPDHIYNFLNQKAINLG